MTTTRDTGKKDNASWNHEVAKSPEHPNKKRCTLKCTQLYIQTRFKSTDIHGFADLCLSLTPAVFDNLKVVLLRSSFTANLTFGQMRKNCGTAFFLFQVFTYPNKPLSNRHSYVGNVPITGTGISVDAI